MDQDEMWVPTLSCPHSPCSTANCTCRQKLSVSRVFVFTPHRSCQMETHVHKHTVTQDLTRSVSYIPKCFTKRLKNTNYIQAPYHH